MQTFLPVADFEQSARILDYRRLGKQRVEAYQLIRTICGTGKMGWKNHPAAKMWIGHVDALGEYMNACILEWVRRGYKNTMPLYVPMKSDVTKPDWLGNPKFHASHRSNLLRKDPKFYSQYGWSEPPDMEYVWPTKGQK